MRTPQDWRSARATLAIAGVTAVVWLVTWALHVDDLAALWGGFIPDRVGGAVPGYPSDIPVWLTPLTATLVHANFLHLLFNLVVLLFCGRAVESVLGRWALLFLYVGGAYAAAAAHYFVHFEDGVPMIGASGAISAVLGAYAMLFGRNKVKVASSRLAVWLHALWLGAAWIVLQLLSGFALDRMGTNLAIAAHIGGFLLGLLLANPLLLLRYRKA